MNTTTEHFTSASAKPGALCSAIPAIDHDERDDLIAALKEELGAYQRESEYMKQLMELARIWTDHKATREALAMKRKVIEQGREIKALKKEIKRLSLPEGE